MNYKTPLREKLILQSILVIIITPLVITLTESVLYSFKLFKLKLALAALVFTLPNLLFIWVLYILKISRQVLLKPLYMILECILLALAYLIIITIIDRLPYEVKFHSTEMQYSQYWFYSETAQVIYAFLLLFLIVVFLKRLFPKYV